MQQSTTSIRQIVDFALSLLYACVIAFVIIAAYDPENPQSSQYAAQIAVLVGQLINMKYGRDDELESDRLGVRFMTDAGFDLRADPRYGNLG